MAYFTCDCCKRTSYAPVPQLIPDAEVPDLCYSCQVRHRRCIHRFKELAMQGLTFHSTRPHFTDGGEDPETCQWCLERVLDRAILDAMEAR